MATTITVKLLSLEQKDGKTSALVELNDGKGKWQKTYDFSQTNTIKLANFKELVEADIRKDLKKENKLSELEPMIGKSFTITL